MTYRDLIAEKLLLNHIKTKLLDLAEALLSDNLTDKQYAVDRLLDVIAMIDQQDVYVPYIKEKGPGG